MTEEPVVVLNEEGAFLVLLDALWES